MKQQENTTCAQKISLQLQLSNFLIFNSHGYLNSKTFANAENTRYNCLWTWTETELKFLKLYIIPHFKSSLLKST